MRGDDRICVLSTGACTAVGLTAAASAAAVRAGIARFLEHPTFLDQHNEPAIVAHPPVSRPDLSLEERLVEFAIAAFADAIKAIPNAVEFGPLPMVIALPEPRPGLDQQLSERIMARLSENLRGLGVLSAVMHGHASGGAAIHHAVQMLRNGHGRWAAVVGLDSWLAAETVGWLDKNRQLHATYNAWGFIPGEAAGVCLISNLATARERTVRPCALIEAVALDREEVPIKVDGVCLGWGLSRAVKSALSALPEGEQVDMIYCDQNGESYRADEFGFMLARMGQRFRAPADFIAPADCWGDTGAATIPLLVTLATQAAERAYAVGTLNLILAGSESGHRAAILLRTPNSSN
ncbi:beta-ketoacyl synthase N-terminal-like domain-containing protein [Mesorhizobium amorphae]|uniref:beta-ketoacyl synthase N-terminal-like domain-containing protein n=1 Tax=Mesorhizobium amorphae TaxID=71433 RepID=UPI001783EB75|nr:beta-ketoacyl synthase N-terminal-like domain-containing protein [Mesorhizobium amorphae]